VQLDAPVHAVQPAGQAMHEVSAVGVQADAAYWPTAQVEHARHDPPELR
jgi:hypothetical protein